MDFELQAICEKQTYKKLCSLYGKEMADEVLAKLDLRPVDMVYTDPADSTHIELYAKQGTLPSRIEPYLRLISCENCHLTL